MKSTGIIRKVDDLGRIVLPIEMRRTLDIAEKDALEIYVEGASVILKKYKPSCIFCDSGKDITEFKGTLGPGEMTTTYYLVVRMRESANNDFQGVMYSGIGITVYAVQGNVVIE